MTTSIRPPDLPFLLIPLLSSLPTATISPTPPSALLPLLSPILRQRLQFLSSSITEPSTSTEPWIHLLTYNDTSKSRIHQLVITHSQTLEPHPVSGEVELDCSTLKTSYLRIDEETFHSFIVLLDLELVVKLTWCVNDHVGGMDGWRISELSMLDGFESAGHATIGEAGSAFRSTSATSEGVAKDKDWLSPAHTEQMDALTGSGEESDDEDDYWASYDRTPGRRTPAPTDRSPGPVGVGLNMTTLDGTKEDASAEEEYYARYATVQPAMERNDPEEEAALKDLHAIDTRGPQNVMEEGPETLIPSPPSVGWEKVDIPSGLHASAHSVPDLPQPVFHSSVSNSGNVIESGSSSRGSGGSNTVANLEGQAVEKEQCEVSVRRHIGNTIKGLYFLAKGTGMGRGEFEECVRREVDCLRMFDEGE